MKTKPDFWYRQSAAVPVRTINGKTEVLLVSSLRSGRWILPKGIVDPGTAPQQSAANEAWEEAGVSGEVGTRRLGVFKNRKWGDVCTVEAFYMNVTKVSEKWPESDMRTRKWFSLEDAIRHVNPVGAAAVLKKIDIPYLRLTLVRHAKASRDVECANDSRRPLSDRGLKDAPEMGRRLRELFFQPDSILSSPAVRARDTARIIADEINFPADDIDEIPAIYDAKAVDLLEVVRSQPDDIRDIMLVGHNPGLTDAALFFLRSGLKNIPTCGIVQIALNARHWKDVSPQCATLLLLDYPRKDASGA